MAEIDKLYDQASNLAVETVEYGAREILKENPDLHEFVMAMGACFFTAKEGGKYDMNSYDEDVAEEMWNDGFEFADDKLMLDSAFERKLFPEFFDNVDDLNEKFKVCGCPMRFTAYSKVVRDWGDTQKNPVQYEDIDLSKGVF